MIFLGSIVIDLISKTAFPSANKQEVAVNQEHIDPHLHNTEF